LLWEWANDPNVRSHSFASAPIPWETHVSWLAEKLGQNGSLLLIAEDERGEPVGQIRFDASDSGETYVNLSIAEQHRSRGLATLLIQLGVQEAFARDDCRQVKALVKSDNTASVRAFENSGFVRAGVEEVRGSLAIRFIYDKK
jgi:RimJ/RimL family protein N-acetyltransferase